MIQHMFIQWLATKGRVVAYRDKPLPRPLFIKQMNVLWQDLTKFQSRQIPIVLRFDRHLSSSAAEMPVKFQNNTIIITSNLVTSKLHEIWR